MILLECFFILLCLALYGAWYACFLKNAAESFLDSVTEEINILEEGKDDTATTAGENRFSPERRYREDEERRDQAPRKRGRGKWQVSIS